MKPWIRTRAISYHHSSITKRQLDTKVRQEEEERGKGCAMLSCFPSFRFLSFSFLFSPFLSFSLCLHPTSVCVCVQNSPFNTEERTHISHPEQQLKVTLFSLNLAVSVHPPLPFPSLSLYLHLLPPPASRSPPEAASSCWSPYPL